MFLTFSRSNQVLKSVLEIGSWFWPGSGTGGGQSVSRGLLRRFLLLKLVAVLLFPHRAVLPLLVCCFFSLQALLLLHCPLISTKPSTVFLGQLAFTDGLVILHWGLPVGEWTLAWWMGSGHEDDLGLMMGGGSVQWRGAVRVLYHQLLHAHHLASLLLLGLLGLEAMLVSRWPQQTRRFRTSHWAQISCSLVWILVLIELLFLVNSKLQDSSPQDYSSTLQDSESAPPVLVLPTSLPVFSFCLRKTLWLGNVWLHYAIIFSKPQKRKSSFH